MAEKKTENPVMAEHEASPEERLEFVVDTYATPTLLVDGIRGLQVRDGIVTINMMRHSYATPTSEVEGHFEETVCRLAMPFPAFVRIAGYFHDSVERLREQGIVPPAEEPKDEAENGD